MYKSLTVTEIKAVEARIGRKLTPREIINGEVERTDTRTFHERIEAESWKPKKAPPKASTRFDEYVADAERAADAERIEQLTPAQRRLHFAKEMQSKELQAQTDAAAMQAHLARHSGQLEKLNALRDSIRLDPSWSAGDAQAIDFAIRQIEAGPLADAEETAKLFVKPFDILAGKKRAQRDEAAAKRAEIEATMATLDAELAALKGNAADDSGARAIAPELANLKTSDEAWDYYVKNFDPNVRDNRSPEHEAASERWYELLETERAAASQQQAAT